ncbi:MAG TPA: cell division protein FtsZ [Pontiella sp.]
MSEFSNDPSQVFSAPRILVMGVGSSGARAVAGMAQLNPGIDAVAVDTEMKTLESLAINRVINVGATVTRGMSAGGDVELGRQSVEKDSTSIRKLLRNVDLLVIVAGLGGGTGSGAVPVITRIASSINIYVLAMVAMPFAFEGKKIALAAEDALKRIRTHADAIIRVPNERLVDRADVDLPVAQAYARSHQVMMDGIFSLWRLLAKTGVCGLDFACIQTMLRHCDGFCHFANADGSGNERAEIVAEGILKHRLLNKGKLLEGARGIIIGMTGGQDLKLSEIETVMERIQTKLPEDIWLNFGVAVDAAFEGRLSVIVLAAEQWSEPLVDPANGELRRKTIAGQGELALETVGKGKFTYADPTIHNNQDLDVPTFQRRNIKLPR